MRASIRKPRSGKRTPAALVALALEHGGAEPLHRQITRRLRAAILDGGLPAGTRLPSTRSLAGQLAAARGTVELAYAALAAEGYIAARGPAGTIVNPTLAAARGPATRELPRAPRAGDPSGDAGGDARGALPAMPQPFRLGLPALDAFPRKLWSRLVARRARGLSTIAMGYQDPAGYLPLRQAIATYLAVARGVACTVDQVFVTAGFHGALGLIVHALLEPGARCWVEDPGFHRARDALAQAGAAIVPVPVDADGIDVAAGIRAARGAGFALVTPAHQSPLGVTLSLSRRLALLSWAARAGAWVIEDDYDSEFRYVGRPLPPLASLDRASGGRVLYCGSFSKVMLPGLRLGYLVVPQRVAAQVAHAADMLAPIASLVDQMALADFLADGHFARHVRRMRKLYAERRAALAAALAEACGARLRVALQAGGMHLVAWLRRGEDDVALARRAAAQGLAPHALSRWRIRTQGKHGGDPALLLGFTNLPADSAAREVARLRDAIGS